MAEKINLWFEEYKMLKEEAKSYTDSNFRDLQILLTVLAVFISFSGLEIGGFQLPLFWNFVIIQLIIYVFLLLQLSRLIYLFILRDHLIVLEIKLNENNIGELEWESVVVPTRLTRVSTLNFQSQLLISLIYVFLFVTSIRLSFIFIDQINNFYQPCYFWITGIQIITLLYLFSAFIVRMLFNTRGINRAKR